MSRLDLSISRFSIVINGATSSKVTILYVITYKGPKVLTHNDVFMVLMIGQAWPHPSNFITKSHDRI